MHPSGTHYEWPSQVYTTPEERQAFLDLVSRNEVNKVSDILSAKEKCDNELLHVALRYAIRADHREMVKLLLTYAKDLEEMYGRPMGLIHLPVFYDNIEMMRILIDAGLNINAFDIHGYTPLLIAAKYGQKDIVIELLKAGADIEMTDEIDGTTAYELARRNGHIEESTRSNHLLKVSRNMDTGGRTVLDFDEVNPFAQAFYEIDADNDGIITKADLERFVRKNNVADDRLVKSWMKLFRASENDIITMQLYKKILGLSEVDRDQANSSQSSLPEPPSYAAIRASETRVISASMSANRQAEIVEEVCRLIAANTDGRSNYSNSANLKFNESQTVADLKQWLESQFGSVWHAHMPSYFGVRHPDKDGNF
ncbi:hypothetical protein Aperf_G00000103290 [Anoplocephala perfoliata]